MRFKACMDCKERHPACHDRCERYQAEKTEHAKEQTWLCQMNRLRVIMPTTVRYDKAQGRYIQPVRIRK